MEQDIMNTGYTYITVMEQDIMNTGYTYITVMEQDIMNTGYTYFHSHGTGYNEHGIYIYYCQEPSWS
jgi:hypothetical protein